MAELLKNQFFQPVFVEKLRAVLAGIHPEFPGKKFCRLVYDKECKNEELSSACPISVGPYTKPQAAV